MGMIDLNVKKITGPVIRLHPNDNVVVARTDVGIGMDIPSEGVTSRSQVPSGHKIAARNIEAGEAILKYLFEREEFKNSQVDARMKTNPALVGPDGA